MSDTPLLDTDGIVGLLIDGAKKTLDSADAEMMPMAFHQLADGAMTMLALAIDLSNDAALAQAMAKGIRGPLHLLAFTSDSYMEVGSEDVINRRRAERGTDLALRFGEGDATVQETVNSLVLFADGRFVQVAQPYVRNHDAGTITWDELKVRRQQGSDLSGRIPDIMRVVLEITKTAERFLTAEGN